MLGGAELVEITTSGDRVRAAGDKSRFVKEIEAALLAGEVDLAVHSAKDVPAVMPDGLVIAAVPPRADPRDVLCGAESLDALPPGARVGTASIRRRSQLLALRDDIEVVELRGNVDTRMRRLADGDYDAIVLAAAGLERLRRMDVGVPLDPLIPAPGQGFLALEIRSDDAETRAAVEIISDPLAFACLSVERDCVIALDATCDTPIGVLAQADDPQRITIRAYAGAPDGSVWIRDELEAGPNAGKLLAERMLSAGAAEILAL
ncbi:MAG TPA: hydroxymethylbilane synthase [Thermoleophilaceae bacterium]|nr:hydroxymethylbilane synthase [Thermoleophilaceae bacterium]